jgi:hypothetical protein
MLAVGFCLELLNESVRVFCSNVGVKGHSRGLAERLEREARTHAALGVGSGVETVDLDREAFFLEWLKVFCVETRPGFSSGIKAGSSIGLLRVANDEDSIVREVVSSFLCRGEIREKKAPRK